MQINELIHGFQLIRKEEVKEISSVAYEFKHIKSGARLLYLDNSDDNKVFSISFRTPPSDDTGVPHIIEHSTLCGSRKFPLKEPFVELVKGSLNTFLNAMTFPDKTMYPVASCNDKDFHNLMDVYLDAVFYPSIYENKQILMQEGWHYEIEDMDEPLQYSGVVYNEMKGALSSPEDLLENEIMRGLYPDNTYACESGGNPKAIPDLTYEAFLDFHKKYYSPANSYIFLYGAMNIEEQLAFIDSEYLSNFDIIDVDSHIPLQQAPAEKKSVLAEYPIGEDESEEAKTFLNYSVSIGQAGDIELLSTVEILEKALLDNPAAPLRKALIDAGLGMDVTSAVQTSVLQPYLSITVNGAEADAQERFEEVLFSTLRDLVTNGIDKELLEAALNLTEFKLREADFGNYPKGLIYGISLMNGWLYDQDPLETLRYEEVMNDLRAKLQTDYYERMLEKYVLNNKFAVTVVMKPNKELGARQDAELAEKLAAKKAAMSEAELREIIATTAELKKRQETPDSPEALATIPVLEIKDIDAKIRHYPLEQRMIDGVKVLYTEAPTNGIAYVNLYFEADVIPQELIPYAYIMGDVIGLLNTKSSTYEELTKRANMHTGGVSSSLDCFAAEGQPASLKPTFIFSAKSFVRELPQLTDIAREILTETEYTDKKRLLELLKENRSDYELEMLQSSVKVAMARLSSHISRQGAYKELGELSLYPLMKKYTDDFEANADELIAKLIEVTELIFGSARLSVGITIEAEHYAEFETAIKPLLASLAANAKANAAQKQNYDFAAQPEQEALLSSSQVQYVAQGANLSELGFERTGYYQVLDVLLRYDYFWTKIRVQGGAYGALTMYAQNGDLIFSSYRDPKLPETLEVFKGTADYLRNFTASEREMTKFIIGAISNIDRPLTPRLLGWAAQRQYLSETTDELRQERRNQLLSTRVEDIRALAPAVEACMQQNNICVFGNSTLIKVNEGIFSKLTPVMD